MGNKNNCNCGVRGGTCKRCKEEYCKHYSTAISFNMCYSCVEEVVKEYENKESYRWESKEVQE